MKDKAVQGRMDNLVAQLAAKDPDWLGMGKFVRGSPSQAMYTSASSVNG